jgi:tetratricopeptide (TPR) repeat protein
MHVSLIVRVEKRISTRGEGPRARDTSRAHLPSSTASNALERVSPRERSQGWHPSVPFLPTLASSAAILDRGHVLAGFALVASMLSACGDDGGPPSVQAQWEAARALWYIDRDPVAFDAWRAIDPATHEGREARRLLGEAEQLYRQGIREVRAGDEDARLRFERAVRMAPMDPRLYLPLARAFRAQAEERPDNPHLFIRAAEYYRKFLVLAPSDPHTDAGRRELSEIDPDGSRLFEPSPRDAPPRDAATGTVPGWPLGVAIAALVLAVVATALLVLRGRRTRRTLEQLAERRPELHPAITYLVGSLRHELLKHRIGAVGDAVDALGEGRASVAELDFLCGRLFEGEPLEAAWEGHLVAFERALGPELDVRRKDPRFRRAGRAITHIARLESRVREGATRAAAELGHAHGELRELDGHLSRLVHRLVRTSVDGALLREVVDAVRREYAAGRVCLDEVAIRAPEPAPMVEVFRVDLVLVLKNVVRNAILAVGHSDPPRRIGLDLETQIEPTGEENVRIHVRDTSDEPLETEQIYARRMDRGLGLVTAALTRYDGTIAVEPGGDGWAKSVVVRFFRAYEDDE